MPRKTPPSSKKPVGKKKISNKKSLRSVVPTATIKKKVSMHRSLSPHRSFRLTNKHNRPRPKPVASSWTLIRETLGVFRRYWRIYALFIVGASLVSWLFIGIISQSDYLGLKDAATDVAPNSLLQQSWIILQSTLDGTITTVTSVQQTIQIVASIMIVLCVIWLTRNLLAGHNVSVRQALYNGPAPFISMSIVLLVLLFQTLPAAIGIYIFSIAASNGFLDPAILGVVIGLLSGLLIVLTLYLVLNTIIALPIVALPGMYPMMAIASAKQLVIGRRLTVLRRLAGLVFALMLLWMVLLLPFIIIDLTFGVESVAYIPVMTLVIGVLNLFIGTVYIYLLYRNMVEKTP